MRQKGRKERRGRRFNWARLLRKNIFHWLKARGHVSLELYIVMLISFLLSLHRWMERWWSKQWLMKKSAKRASTWVGLFALMSQVFPSILWLFPLLGTCVKLLNISGRDTLGQPMYQLRETSLKKAIDRTSKGLEPLKKQWMTNGCSLMTDRLIKWLCAMNMCVHCSGGVSFYNSKEECATSLKDPLIFQWVDEHISEVGENVVHIVTDLPFPMHKEQSYCEAWGYPICHFFPYFNLACKRCKEETRDNKCNCDLQVFLE